MSWGADCAVGCVDVAAADNSGGTCAAMMRSQDTADLLLLPTTLLPTTCGSNDPLRAAGETTARHQDDDDDDDDDVAVASATDLIRRYNPTRQSALAILQAGRETENSVLEPSSASGVVKKQNNKKQLRIVDPHGSFTQPYKVEYFERELFEHDPGPSRRTAVIQTLRIMGVKVYVIEQLSIANSNRQQHDLVKQIRSVVKWTREEGHQWGAATAAGHSRGGGSLIGPQRCLLYEDLHGRLFNLVFSSVVQGPAAQWREYYDAFSTSRAIAALVVLVRSMPCLLYSTCSVCVYLSLSCSLYELHN